MKLLLPSARPLPFASYSYIASSLRGPSYSTSIPSSLILQPNQLSQNKWHTRRTLAHSATSTATSRIQGSQNNADTSPSLSDQVRLLMRRVPYPVSIITATDPSFSADNNKPLSHSFRGMTVSSFNTVTLTPEPVISFNVKRPSETLTALRSSRRFLAHLLAPNKATATLARDFSRGNHNLTILDGKGEFEFVAHDSADGRADSKLPLLRRRGAAENGEVDFPFIFECRVNEKEMEVHDHTIVLGTVERTLVGGSGRYDDDDDAQRDFCLSYADTRFWGMGRQI